jgi:hypothetical protein
MTAYDCAGARRERVYLLRPELLPHPRARTPAQQRQEENLRYVAYGEQGGDARPRRAQTGPGGRAGGDGRGGSGPVGLYAAAERPGSGAQVWDPAPPRGAFAAPDRASWLRREWGHRRWSDR